MGINLRIDSVFKKTVVPLATALLLAACNDSGTSNAGQGKYEIDGDHAIGSPDAPITVVEYASVVCAACANWHNNVYPDFKKTYIDTGKVRFVFRGFPTRPENYAYAGFTIANCADKDRFFDNISMQFKRQRAILGSQDPRKAYEDLAKASGLSVADYEACLADEDWRTEYETRVQTAVEAGINATPTFIINGTTEKVFLLEDFEEKFVPIIGETLEAEDDTPEDAEDE